MNFAARFRFPLRASLVAFTLILALALPLAVQVIAADAAVPASAAKKKKKKCKKGYVKAGKKCKKKKSAKKPTTPGPTTPTTPTDPGTTTPGPTVQAVVSVKVTDALVQGANVKVMGNVVLDSPEKRPVKGTLTIIYKNGFTVASEFTTITSASGKSTPFTEFTPYDSTQTGLAGASVTMEGVTDNLFLP